MLRFRVLLVICLVVLAAGCKKEPGEGGTSSIKGKILRDIRLVVTNPGTYQYTVPAADQDVYIVYGDHISPDDRVWTNYEGEFEFINLREGEYTLYVYSRDTTGAPGADPDHMVVKKLVEITDKKQEVDAGTLRIYDTP